MSKEKYFSVDVSNDIHIINLHETLEEAKQSCLNNAAEAYDFAREMDDSENYECNDLPHAVYGLILGRAKSDKRPITEEEKESGYFETHTSHIIEPPILVETESWISVKEKMPKEFDTVLVFNGNIFIAELNGSRFITKHEEPIKSVSHWHSLPKPPHK